MQDSKVTCMFDANGIKLSRFWENPDSSREKNAFLPYFIHGSFSKCWLHEDWQACNLNTSQQPRPETRPLCLKNCVKSSESLGGGQCTNSQLLQTVTAALKPEEEHWLISEDNLAYCLFFTWISTGFQLESYRARSFTLLSPLLCSVQRWQGPRSYIEESKPLTTTVINIAKSISPSPLPHTMHCSTSIHFCFYSNCFSEAEPSAQKHPTHVTYCSRK